MTGPSSMPRQGVEPPIGDGALPRFLVQVPRWNVVDAGGQKRLQRSFGFGNFAEALRFTVKVGQMAEAENHHPLLVTEWGKVTVTWWTHRIGGLHPNDFAMAARTDALYSAGNG
jgi:4a-hydroxytetrahydrobiopterin dehydratase